MWLPWEIRWPDIRGAPLRLRCAVVDVLEWLLDSDPAVRWQVKRDLLGAPAEEEVLSGLLEYERATGGSPRVHDVRLRGQEYLLERRMRRRLSNGEVIDPEWDLFSFPTYWHYDVLRGLDFLRSAGAGPDPRVAEAVGLVRSKADPEGRWPLENPHPGRLHFPIDGAEGRASRWNTLRALRVLRWADSG